MLFYYIVALGAARLCIEHVQYNMLYSAGTFHLISMRPERSHQESVRLAQWASRVLLAIYDELDGRGFTRETIPAEFVNQACKLFDDLESDAKRAGDVAKVEIFRRLSTAFYTLNTVGVADNQGRFEDAAGRAFELVEVVLLGMDGSSPEHKGEILRRVQESRERI